MRHSDLVVHATLLNISHLNAENSTKEVLLLLLFFTSNVLKPFFTIFLDIVSSRVNSPQNAEEKKYKRNTFLLYSYPI